MTWQIEFELSEKTVLTLPLQTTAVTPTNDAESTGLIAVGEFLSHPYLYGFAAMATILALGVAIYSNFMKRKHSSGGKGGDALVENADGEAVGGKGGKGGGSFGPGGDGGNASVIGGKGKAKAGDGGDGG